VFTFFDLRCNDIYRICSFLPCASVIALSQTNRVLYQWLSEKREFYLPLCEQYSNSDLQCISSWNGCSSTLLYNRFYLNKEHLFQHKTKAHGCYKVRLSWLDILKIKSEDDRKNNQLPFNITALEQAQYQWLVPIKAQHIISYINKSSLQEFLNPYKDQVKEEPRLRLGC